jgi:hypothetical protein
MSMCVPRRFGERREDCKTRAANHISEGAMRHSWENNRVTPSTDKRSSERKPLTVPARLAWKDQRGVNRFASVITRDVSELGVFVESASALSIPLYRLVQFQVEPNVRSTHELPEALRQGRILSAVYRISHGNKTAQHGLALRLLVAPKLKNQADETLTETRATA